MKEKKLFEDTNMIVSTNPDNEGIAIKLKHKRGVRLLVLADRDTMSVSSDMGTIMTVDGTNTVEISKE